ncbi:flagellar brake protein [Nitrosophilus kaiyonis]|uniref:flagellar brake protein n=1 Tax=Nitrosophilus kaiyonis TaxID=2930200 RepID=UPI00249299B6|nr:PilZ domain-containing protein [Nitrosophilus kaiyonis]
MTETLSRFETLKLAAQHWTQTDLTSILIIVFFILGVMIILVGGILLQKFLKSKNVHSYFFNYAKEKGLTNEEAKLLWDYSQKMGRDPLLVLEFKSPFEKVVDLYIKTDPNPKENLVQDMRKKLGFNIVYNFIPLMLSKDIEMFQNGKLILNGKQAFDTALYDKDEKFMYWLLIDIKSREGIEPGAPVKITFLRRGDAIYNFESTIVDVIQEGHNIVIKIPHTFEMNRIQRREFPRIETDLPAMVGITKIVDGNEEIIWHTGRILDISASGAKFCVPVEEKNSIKFSIGENILVKFELNGEKYEIEANVENKDEREISLCYGLKFKNIKDKVKDKIFEYVQKEQRKMAKLARMQK